MSTRQFAKLNPALAGLKPSATLVINERSVALAAKGKNVYRLGFGQSPFPVPEEVVSTLKKHAHVKDYLPVKGLQRLREAVVSFNQRTLGITSKADNILIAPGSKQLIYSLKLALDGVVLLPSPSWVSYQPQAELAQRAVEWIDTNSDNGWRITPESVAKACAKYPTQTKILILNYPNNPVGNTYNAQQLRTLATVFEKYGVVVIADEIYGEVKHEGAHTSLAKYYPQGTVISGGLSKWCGAGGWRLGTFTFPEGMEHVVDMMAKIASETYTSVAAPIQYAAITAFEGSPAITEYVKQSRVILKTVANYVYHALQDMNIEVAASEGGFYLFPNFKNHSSKLAQKGIATGQQLCEALLEETGVALLPGIAFGRPNEEFTARLSFVDFDGGKALEALQNGAICDLNFIKTYCPNIVASMKSLAQWLD